MRLAAPITLLIALAACKPSAPAGPASSSLDSIELVRGGALPNEPLPMIVIIHGLGDSPENIARIFEEYGARARLIFLRAPDTYGRGYSWFPVGWQEGSVQVKAEDVSKAAAKIAAKVEELVKSRPTSGKPIVTGFSQGGMLSFALAFHHPELFSRAIPIAGWLPPELLPEAAQAKLAVPIIAMHGEEDRLVPYARSKEMIDVLASRGLAVRFISVPGVAHTMTPGMQKLLFEELAKP